MWAGPCSRPPPPVRLGPAFLGSPCSPRPTSCSRRGSGRTLPLRRGLLPGLMPPCHRRCSSLSSPDAFRAQPPHQGSGPGLRSPPWCCHLPSNNPRTPTSRSPSLQAHLAWLSGTGGLGDTGAHRPCGVVVLWGLWRKCSSKQVSLSGTRAGVSVSMPPPDPPPRSAACGRHQFASRPGPLSQYFET